MDRMFLTCSRVVPWQLREKRRSLGSQRLVRHLGHYLRQDNEEEVCLTAGVVEFLHPRTKTG